MNDLSPEQIRSVILIALKNGLHIWSPSLPFKIEGNQITVINQKNEFNFSLDEVFQNSITQKALEQWHAKQK